MQYFSKISEQSFRWVEALSTTQAALQALAAMNSSLAILRPLWATAVRRWTRLSNHQLRVKEKQQNRRYQVFLDCEQHLRRNLWERKKRCTSRGLISNLLCITIMIFHYYNFRHYHCKLLSSGDLASIKSVHNPRRSSAFSALPTEPLPLPPRWFLQSLQFIKWKCPFTQGLDTWIYVTVPFLGRRHSLLKSLELLCFSDKNVDPSPVFSPKMGFLGQVTTGNV